MFKHACTHTYTLIVVAGLRLVDDLTQYKLKGIIENTIPEQNKGMRIPLKLIFAQANDP